MIFSGAPRRRFWLMALCLIGCGHSDPFGPEPQRSDDPFAPGAPLRLTYSANADYEARWQAGDEVLYTFAIAGGDRCLGLLPATGGPRRWELCDDDPARANLAKSFGGAAFDGQRLIYVEATSIRGRVSPDETVLWLADRAIPLQRREIFRFPTNLGGGAGVSWLSNIRWTGSDAFVALGQLLVVAQPAPNVPYDTTLIGTAVVRGTITATGAALSLVVGTLGAQDYALVENGGTVVFTDGNQIRRVPIAGGVPTTIPVTIPAPQALACRGATCAAVSPMDPAGSRILRFPLAGGEPVEAGTSTIRLESISASADGADLVAVRGTKGGRDLILFRNVFP